MSLSTARPVNILLVEDDETDVLLIRKTLQHDRIANKLDHVVDGIEAMRYLRKESPYSEAPRPDLVLLDLNMPRKSGREVLKECYEDDSLRTIPIVVFTSSDDERDVMASYNYKASSYVTKPVDLIQFRKVLADLEAYWFCIVTLPRQNES